MKDLREAILASGWFDEDLARQFERNAAAWEFLGERAQEKIAAQFSLLASEVQWAERLRKHDDELKAQVQAFLRQVNFLLAYVRIESRVGAT